MKTVYLAGPIAGLTELEAKDWRNYVMLAVGDATDKDIRCVSPLRCELAIEGKYDLPSELQSMDARFGTPEAIGAKNELDVRSCDMVLAFFPERDTRTIPSVGTIVEVGMAYALGKPVILVSGDDYIRNHPLIGHCSKWVLDTLEEAVDVIVGVLEVYT